MTTYLSGTLFHFCSTWTYTQHTFICQIWKDIHRKWSHSTNHLKKVALLLKKSGGFSTNLKENWAPASNQESEERKFFFFRWNEASTLTLNHKPASLWGSCNEPDAANEASGRGVALLGELIVGGGKFAASFKGMFPISRGTRTSRSEWQAGVFTQSCA